MIDPVLKVVVEAIASLTRRDGHTSLTCVDLMNEILPGLELKGYVRQVNYDPELYKFRHSYEEGYVKPDFKVRNQYGYEYEYVWRNDE